jgi:hypothetical protein
MRRQLLLAAAVLFLARLLLSFLRTGPVVVADEVGYLTNARVLAGGTSGQLQDAPFYRGGYSLLIAPLLRLTDDPHTAYRLVLALNAVLAAILLPLLYLLLVRCFAAPPRTAFWGAAAASAYPSVTLFSQAALSESLLLPLTVGWLLCCAEALASRGRRGQYLWGAAAGLAAAALYAVHGRMIVAVALTILGLVVLAVRGRVPAAAAALGSAVAIVGLGLVRLLDDYLITHNYGGRRPDEVGQRLSTLDHAGGVLVFLRNLAGQSWYLTVATLGVVLWALLSVRRAEVREAARRDARPSTLIVVLMLATLGGLLVLSALSFPEIDRADMMIYGRYTEIVMPPLLAVALVRLPRARVRLPALVIGLGTLVVVLLRTTVHPPGDPSRWNVGSLPFLTRDLGPVPLLGAGLVAVAALAGLALLVSRRPTLVAPVLLVLFLPTTLFIEHEPVLSGEHGVYPAGWVSPGTVDTHGRPVAYDVDHHQGLYVNQWFMPHSHFLLFSGSEAPPAPYVISSIGWGAEHPKLHPTRLWTDPAHDHALFRVARAQ